MQKHNEWLSNRGYIQHLQVLQKIQARKTQNTGKTLPSRIPQERSTCVDEAAQKRGQQEALCHNFTKSKDNLTIRDQRILWDNYYLGKRIIQTPPVISKRRMDQDYRKHKRLVQCLTASNNRKVMTTEFRVKKLQQYKQNMELISEDRAIQVASHRYFIRIQIKNLAFYRQRPVLDRLDLILTYSGKEGKQHKQSSESFPAEQLLNRHFYFNIPKRMVQKQEPLSVELRNYKGLCQLSVGYFSFPSGEQLQNYKAQLFHCGKPAGQIQISTSCAKKQDWMKQIESMTQNG